MHGFDSRFNNHCNTAIQVSSEFYAFIILDHVPLQFAIQFAMAVCFRLEFDCDKFFSEPSLLFRTPKAKVAPIVEVDETTPKQQRQLFKDDVSESNEQPLVIASFIK